MLTLTDRLELRPLALDDIDAVFDLHADPRVWTHLPSGQYRDRADAVRLVEEAVRAWREHGLGYWTVRTRQHISGATSAGSFVGVAGVTRAPGPVWNLYYRLAPEAHGHGLAAEAATAAMKAAADVDATIPVTAYLLEHNTASKRTAERLGLQQVWQGPDHGNPDHEAVRLLYADRSVRSGLLQELIGR